MQRIYFSMLIVGFKIVSYGKYESLKGQSDEADGTSEAEGGDSGQSVSTCLGALCGASALGGDLRSSSPGCSPARVVLKFANLHLASLTESAALTYVGVVAVEALSLAADVVLCAAAAAAKERATAVLAFILVDACCGGIEVVIETGEVLT